MINAHSAILERLQEQRQENYKALVRQAINLLSEAAKQAPSCQEKCDLTSAILNIQEAVVKKDDHD